MNWQTPAIKKQEVYHYLGCKRGEASLDQQIDRMMKKVIQDADCRVIYREFPLVNHHCINLSLPGDDIKRLLKESERCIVMAATIGFKVEREFRFLQIKDMGDALIYDACANAMIESLCDDVNERLIQLYHQQGAYLTDRFSCGYGDLPITTQEQFIQVLDARRKIGLHVNEHSILVPGKSVTAILGIASVPQPALVRGCGVCALKERCAYRKGGTTCGT